MSGSNNNRGHQIPQGVKFQLSADAARKKFENDLKAMDTKIAELKTLIKDLEDFVEESDA